MCAVAIALGALAAIPAASARPPAGCATPPTHAVSTRRTLAVLGSGRDLWGEQLRAHTGGPTLASAQALLAPLYYARAAQRSSLTQSGAYYLPFAEPVGPLGAGAVALHLADGSQILSQRIGGASLTIGVGGGGSELFGSCLARLATPGLAAGYLPILELSYRDAQGASYHQESFAATLPALHGLVSFVRLTVDARRARFAVEARFTLSAGGLRSQRNRLVAGAQTALLFSPGARADGSSVTYRIAPGDLRTILVAYFIRPATVGALPSLARVYAHARRIEAAYWVGRLRGGASIAVPEREVDDAEKALLIQNLVLGYRYSIGNAYQEFSFPETIDVARVMGEWGFAPTDESIMALSLDRAPTPYPNWTRGEKLIGFAEYYGLFHDRRTIVRFTPVLAGYVALIGRELSARDDLLPAERYSSDIALRVSGLPAQTVVWQGLKAMGGVWAATGYPALAARCHLLAARLHAGLVRAVARSQLELPDGSLFVPATLLDGERPYAQLTRSRLGSYWNLVMPYALASGFFAPGGRDAKGILDYLQRHGALLLGLVRAGAYALYGHSPPAPVSGTDEVYGTNLERFLADNGQAGEIVLSLYGELADAMTPGTFVAGEAASVAPLPGEGDRAMYLPPNSAANAAFLETLRLTLAHEVDGAQGRPEGLQLGYATPRGWLEPGREIAASDLPTSYGPLSFTIAARRRTIRVRLQALRTAPSQLDLRLRLPGNEQIVAVTIAGRRYRSFDRASATIDLSGLDGVIDLTITVS